MVTFQKMWMIELKAKIRGIWNLKDTKDDAIYLGNPLFLKKNKSMDFNSIRERIEKRLEGRKSRLLSLAGRSTLIISHLFYVNLCYGQL